MSPDDPQFRRPMSRGQSVQLLVASGVMLVGAVILGVVLAPAAQSLDQTGHLIKSHSRQSAADFLWWLPYAIGSMGAWGVWAAIKGLFTGR